MHFDALKHYFLEYADRYIQSGDAELAGNCALKRDHTLYVLEEAELLIDALDFDPDDAEAVRTAALLHDYGRFEQLRIYGTFADRDSIDHGRLSAQLSCRDGLLDSFDRARRRDIAGAIACHNARELPVGLNERSSAYCNVVRDADKIDIFRVILTYLEDPAQASIVLGLPGGLTISQSVLETLEQNKQVDHRDLKTPGDFLASKFAWTAELTSKTARARLKSKNVLSKILSFLPPSETLNSIAERAERQLNV